jgi:hypothetical protein
MDTCLRQSLWQKILLAGMLLNGIGSITKLLAGRENRG